MIRIRRGGGRRQRQRRRCLRGRKRSFGNPDVDLLAGLAVAGEAADEVEVAVPWDYEGVVSGVEGAVWGCGVA